MGVQSCSPQGAGASHAPSFFPSLLVVTNFAHVLGGEGGISGRDGCLHVAVAFLSTLPKIISANLSQ
jgi:hypothetical protein